MVIRSRALKGFPCVYLEILTRGCQVFMGNRGMLRMSLETFTFQILFEENGNVFGMNKLVLLYETQGT